MTKTVFITGGATGIGQACVQKFHTMGWNTAFMDINTEAGHATADSLPGVRFYPGDVKNKEQIAGAIEQTLTAFGGLDSVIANAGISHGVKTEFEEDLDVLEAVYRINVFAMAYTFHPFIAGMKARGEGQLVGMGSVAGIRGLPGSEAYCASKSAVITYCESLRVEMRKAGIMVTTICPGFVRTPLTAANPYKMPFILEPEEFARQAVEAIASRKSYAVIPWQMGVLAKILRLLPNPLFDKILSNRKQKPRVSTKS